MVIIILKKVTKLETIKTQVFGYLTIKLQDTTLWYKNQNTVQSYIIY